MPDWMRAGAMEWPQLKVPAAQANRVAARTLSTFVGRMVRAGLAGAPVQAANIQHSIPPCGTQHSMKTSYPGKSDLIRPKKVLEYGSEV